MKKTITLGLALGMLSVQALAADTVLIGSWETGTEIEISKQITVPIDMSYAYEEDHDAGYGSVFFKAGKMTVGGWLQDTESCFLQVYVSRPQPWQPPVPQRFDFVLKAGDRLKLNSTKMTTRLGVKEVEITFDRDTTSLPDLRLICQFPGKSGQAITAADARKILGDYFKLEQH